MLIKKPAIFNFWYRRNMKWPASTTVIRHDVSKYNVLWELKAKSELYQDFKREFEKDWTSVRCYELALQVKEELALPYSNKDTPLVEVQSDRAYYTGCSLEDRDEKPDVIFVSPFLRTKQTFEAIKRGYPALADVRFYYDERIREQDYGIAELYNDWRVFHVLHPDQKRLYDQKGDYWYQYPQGESRTQVRDRARSFATTLTRDFHNKKVMVFTHHLWLLAFVANMERWDDVQFENINQTDKPLNCGVTTFRGIPNYGSNGKFFLESYNQDLSVRAT